MEKNELSNNGDQSPVRRAAVIKGKQMDVQELKSYIQDLKTTMNLNKEMLFNLLEFKTTQVPKKVLQRLVTQNQQLQSSLQTEFQKLSVCRAQALIKEQIASEHELKQEQIAQQFKQKIQELEYQRDRKSLTLQQVKTREKHLKGSAEVSKKTKYITVTPPSALLIYENNRIECTKQKMEAITRNFFSALRYKKAVQESCNLLVNDCKKLQVLINNPLNRKTKKNIHHGHKREFSLRPFDEQISIEYKIHQQFVNVQQEINFLEIDSQEAQPENRQQKEKYLKILQFKKEINSMQKQTEQCLIQIVDILQVNQQLRTENQKLASDYEKIILEIDQRVRNSQGFDLQYPRSSIQINTNTKSPVIYTLPVIQNEEEDEIEIRADSFYAKHQITQFPYKIPKQQMEEIPGMGVEHTGVSFTQTSTMAAVFDEGVILGADSRTTMGSYIASRVSDKIEPIHDRIFCLRSGVSAHTQLIAHYVRHYLSQYATVQGNLPEVSVAARLMQQMSYHNKNFLQAGLICGGWDPVCGPSVYQIPMGGSLVQQKVAMAGSGSTFIYGFVDSNWREGMGMEECKEFVKQGLSLAMTRDGSSGGIIRLAIVTPSEVVREYVSQDNLPYKL